MNSENITRIRVVYNALEELAKDVVFVGGATVSFYADRPAGESRPTDDVDILIELMHYGDYALVEEKLRSKGFTNETSSGVIGRYSIQGIIVDVMPTGENALGFTNIWYKPGYATAVIYALDANYYIRIFQPVYFLASKIEAFKNRGGGDGRWSSDFEDIIYVLNNRSTVWNEMRESENKVKAYLKEQFRTFLEGDFVDEWISAHLEFYEQSRIRTILGELDAFVNS